MKKALILLLISTYLYTCTPLENEPNCSRGYYNFTLPISFEPQDSVIKLGDTITITSKFPNELWDQDSSDIFVFDKINFYMGCGVGKSCN